MSIELGNLSLERESQELTYLGAARTWIHEHSAMIKISKIAGLLLGVGVGLIAIPFVVPHAFSIRGGAICVGIGSGIVGGLISALSGYIIAATLHALCGTDKKLDRKMSLIS